ncbi:MAG: electron transfer flavoprotein subunit beta/FixA family protein [Kineosporiaceae bacterium]|nr:electron transfer flavoprotein subunit beta/FixA family protein [Kineosporiaceae bacterium]
MKIVVCVKHVPDAQGDRRFTDDHTVDREGVDGLLSELDEYAVEEALTIAEARSASGEDSTVTVLCMGPEGATDAVRKALQMGADAGVHVCDDALAGSDALATSKVLAAALRTLEFDLVLTGMASTDGLMSVVPAMLAQRLGLPQVTLAGKVELDGTTVRIERDGDSATEVIEAPLPALVSVTDQINDPRYPSFKGIMAAKKKPVNTLSLADLGLSPDDVGLSAAWSVVEAVAARPPRQAGQRITDEGDGGTRLVEFLAGAKIV